MEDSSSPKSDTNSDREEQSQEHTEVSLSQLLESVKDVSYNYQYLDHPADVILLGEGKSLKDSLQSVSVSLFNYLSDLSYVDVTHHKRMEVKGRGLLNLLYHFLDECLYLYSGEYFIAKHVLIEEDLILPLTNSEDEFNNYEFNLKAVALGDYYNRSKHKCGTEIKAITMHYLNFNIFIGDQWYEYKNDMESQDQTAELLNALRDKNNNITRCKVYALVDI